MKASTLSQIQQTEQISNNNVQESYMKINSLQSVKVNNEADLEAVFILHLKIDT